MSEEYLEDPLDETAEVEETEAVSDVDPLSTAEDEEESPVEQPHSSDEEPVESDLDPQIRALGRDLYGRYGGMQSELSTLSRTVSDLVEMVRGQVESAQEGDSAYSKLDSEQRASVDALLESHPLIQELRNKVGSAEKRETDGMTSRNQQLFASAIQDVRSNHGDTVAEELQNDLVPLAELTNWDLAHPAFQTRLKQHHDRLEAAPQKKQEARRKATSERGDARPSARDIPKTAKVKGKSGSDYYDFEKAVDIAVEEVRNTRRS